MRLFLNSVIVISFLSLVGILVLYIWDPGSRDLISQINATLLAVARQVGHDLSRGG